MLTDNKKRYAERHVFLCDGMIIICKQQTKRANSTGVQAPKYTVRDKFLIRRLDVEDCHASSTSNSDDLKCLFELDPKDQPKVIFKADSVDEKKAWMAALVRLTTKQMLERNLDSVLAEEEKKHPLRFPPSKIYEFAEPNSDQNIVFTTTDNAGGVPLIKVCLKSHEKPHCFNILLSCLQGATLIKLVERLTYHVYADPMFMKTFLITYRTFCTPDELLDLLMKVSFHSIKSFLF